MGWLIERSEWESWAKEWGLTYAPQRGRWIKNEAVVGPYKGYLIRVGWSGDYGGELHVLLRFPTVASTDVIRDHLLKDGTLSPALPRSPRQRKALIQVTDSAVVIRRMFLWSRPNAGQVRAWVETLAQSLATVTRPFEGRCEQCQASGVNDDVLIEGVPVFLCRGCQARMASEGAMAERRYEQLEANYGAGLLFGLAGACVGGGLWALLAVLTQRLFAIVAIGIAWLAAWGYAKGAGKIDGLGRFLAASLTIVGVFWGETLSFAYLIHQQRPDIPFRLDIGWALVLQSLFGGPGEVWGALFFGFMGAWYSLRMLQRPRFQPKVERQNPS